MKLPPPPFHSQPALSRIFRLLPLLLGGLVALPAAAAQQPYARFPALHGETVVFTAEGDLWRANLGSGQAHRLTTHAGEESRAAISPDGRSVAFVAHYDGPAEVYVMPIDGGQPRRISFEGSGSRVLGWSAQGEILYGVQAQKGPNALRVVVKVAPDGSQRQVLPLADATEASLDETGNILYFTRLGHHIYSENVRRYRGGSAAQIWRFDLRSQQEAQRLSPASGSVERQPMWWQGRLYFISDRSGSDNLWSMRADGSDARQHTQHQEWDVRQASLHAGQIIYQLGADLQILNLAQGQSRPLALQLSSDFAQRHERLIKRPLEFLTALKLAPQGERVALTVRGKLWLAGLPPLRRIAIGQPAGSRVHESVISADGKHVYAICDASGEHEIWRFATDGSGTGQQLTHGGRGQRLGLWLAPDGKSLVHSTKQGELFLLDLGNGKNSVIDRSPSQEYADIVWSPDSQSLAIVRAGNHNHLSQVWLYSLAKRQIQAVTSDKYTALAPSFTPDGKWLYLIGERNFQTHNSSPWGERHMGPFFDRRSKIYAYPLQAGLSFPFAAKTELDPPSAATNSNLANPVPRSVFEVPLPAGNYSQLANDGKRLYWLENEHSKPHSKTLKSLAIDNSGSPAETIISDLASYQLSQNGKKLLLRKAAPQGNGDLILMDAGSKAPADLSKATLALANWQTPLEPRVEWQQMFDDAWRMQRDYLFDAKLRGIDWSAMHKKYRPLLQRVNDKYELNDLLGMMMAELGTLHSQISIGDVRKAEDGSMPAYLGGVLEKHAQGYKIAHIYQSEIELPSELAPLAQAGLDIRVGDIIQAVNGKNVLEVADISVLLRNQAGQQLLLHYLRPGENTKSPTKQAIVIPVDANRNAALRYGDWEYQLQEKVLQQSQGKIGYLHLRSMVSADMNAFVREFYSHIGRDGLIIDVRRNGGGNIDSWIVEKLLRRTWMFWQPREGKPETHLQQSFRGHVVVLADELTYSDGETFTAAVKELGLAKVIGKRTAGAGVWLSDNNDLSDKGRARAAETAQYRIRDGAWLIEGRGVSPDIEVDNLPHASFKGQDAQLEAAITWLQEKLQKDPIPALRAQPLPERNP